MPKFYENMCKTQNADSFADKNADENADKFADRFSDVSKESDNFSSISSISTVSYNQPATFPMPNSPGKSDTFLTEKTATIPVPTILTEKSAMEIEEEERKAKEKELAKKLLSIRNNPKTLLHFISSARLPPSSICRYNTSLSS